MMGKRLHLAVEVTAVRSLLQILTAISRTITLVDLRQALLIEYANVMP